MGRPESYSENIAHRICIEIANGSNLNRLCSTEDFPSRPTVYKWLVERPDFFDKYARARESRADSRADRIDSLSEKLEAGEIDPNAARVLFDIERWQAGKEKPKVYGDRIHQNIAGADGETLKIEVTGIRPTKENT